MRSVPFRNRKSWQIKLALDMSFCPVGIHHNMVRHGMKFFD